MLVVELGGKIKVLPPPYTPATRRRSSSSPTSASGRRAAGLYDIALDPNFATNHYYYVFYTAGDVRAGDRLSRFTANADLTGTVAGQRVVLYQDPQDANAEHHGGAIAFGNDGKIYFTTGEHFEGRRPGPDQPSRKDPPHQQGRQRPDRQPVLRRRRARTWTPSGPTASAIRSAPITTRRPGAFYIGDVGGNEGSTSNEEINLGTRGANYGWPNFEGPCPSPCTSPMYDYAHNGRDAAITGGFVYHGAQFPS